MPAGSQWPDAYSNGGFKASNEYSIGGISLSYTGGWLGGTSIMEERGVEIKTPGVATWFERSSDGFCDEA